MRRIFALFFIWVLLFQNAYARTTIVMNNPPASGGGGGGTLLDSFTDSDSTALDSHTGEVVTWTLRSGSQPLNITSNRLRPTNNGGITDYYSSQVMTDADASLQWICKVGASGNVTPMHTLRHATGAQTFIGAYWQGAWKIRQCSSGSCSQIGGSSSTNSPVSAERTVVLEVLGTSVYLDVDGVEVSSGTVSVTAAGRVGAVSYFGDNSANHYTDDLTYTD